MKKTWIMTGALLVVAASAMNASAHGKGVRAAWAWVWARQAWAEVWLRAPGLVWAPSWG